MNDDLNLLAAADPAPASRWPQQPLDEAAEWQLRRLLLSGQHPSLTGRRVWATASATGAAGILAAMVLVASYPTQTTASPAPVVVQPVAAPAPLVVDPSAPVPALTDLATIAAQRAAGGRPSAVLGGHLGTWFLSFGIAGEGTPAIVLPDEQLAVPTADGGLTVTRVPADPTLPQQVRLHPGRTALNDAEVTVLQAADVAANAIPNAPPPTDSEALTAYLSAAAATAPSNDAVAMTAALEQVLTNWTPGPAESAAIASWLAQQPSLTALGAVTDRLGRPGVAYRMDATNGEGAAATRRTIVLSPFTGAVLSMELSFLDDPGEYDVKPYAVISYEAYDLE